MSLVRATELCALFSRADHSLYCEAPVSSTADRHLLQPILTIALPDVVGTGSMVSRQSHPWLYHPGAKDTAYPFTRRTHCMPNVPVTAVSLAMNVAIFGLMLAWGIDPMQPAIEKLIQWGANYGPKTTQGEWWRMFTCMFLHIGVLHLLFNMVALWNVGGFMEHLLGSTGFLVLYLLAGLLGSVASVAWNPFVVSAGASGAIFGLFGGLLAFLVRHRDLQQYAFLAALRTNTLAFLGYNLVYGFLVQGID